MDMFAPQWIRNQNTMRKTKRNIYFLLANREITTHTYNRKDFQILRTLICHSDRKFTRVWGTLSKTNIHFECGRVFSDHYRVCHFGYAVGGGPVQAYNMPKVNLNTCKLEDALIYRCYHEEFHHYENKAYLFGIQAHGVSSSLMQYSLDTGQMVRQILFSPIIKFKQISWVVQNKMFVVRSKQHPHQSRLHMAVGMPRSNVAVVMAVFAAFPFSFVGMFEVDKRVFGNGIIQAILSHSLLIVMFNGGYVRFYSFQYILEKFKLFDHSLDQVENIEPQGLPMNIKITECPPVLFEVRCADHDVQIGGYPWHYLIQPYGTLGIFSVYSLENHKKVKEGTLESKFIWAEADRCVFHNDNSGRILHIRAPEIGIYNLLNNEDGNADRCTLNTQAIINLLREQPKHSEVQMTSSGRSVKRRQNLNEVDSDQEVIIHQVDYEDELDLTWISAVCGKRGNPNIVCFYDNQDFKLLREIELQQKWEEVYENSVYVDLDTIVQVVKPNPGLFVCTMYRLSGSEIPAVDDTSSKHGQTLSRGSSTGRNHSVSQRLTRMRTNR